MDYYMPIRLLNINNLVCIYSAIVKSPYPPGIIY